MKRVRTMRLIAATSGLMVFFAAVSVVYGGLSWTGFDPDFDLTGKYEGTHINVILQGQDDGVCPFSSAEITIKLPKKSGYENLVIDYSCGDIDVKFKRGKGDKIEVKVLAQSSDENPLNVILAATNEKGLIEKLCEGETNSNISCKLNLKKLR